MTISITTGITGLLFAGFYSSVVYLIVVNLFSVKKRLSLLGIRSEWLAFVGLLFLFGFTKHEIGYYTSLYPGYCKQTGICEKKLKNTDLNLIDKLSSFLGFEENVWFEAAGEGLVYVVVGTPLFLFIRPQLLAAFATGIISHLVSEHSGINGQFCRTSCSLNPLSNV